MLAVTNSVPWTNKVGEGSVSRLLPSFLLRGVWMASDERNVGRERTYMALVQADRDSGAFLRHFER